LPIEVYGMQARVLRGVMRAGANGIVSTDLFDALYGDDPNGGPSTGNKVLAVWVTKLNKQLAAVGKRIKCTGWGHGIPGTYKYQSVISIK
jgi:hypothetical protein